MIDPGLSGKVVLITGCSGYRRHPHPFQSLHTGSGHPPIHMMEATHNWECDDVASRPIGNALAIWDALVDALVRP